MDKSSTNDLQQTVTAESNLQDVVTLVSSMMVVVIPVDVAEDSVGCRDTQTET